MINGLYLPTFLYTAGIIIELHSPPTTGIAESITISVGLKLNGYKINDKATLNPLYVPKKELNDMNIIIYFIKLYYKFFIFK